MLCGQNWYYDMDIKNLLKISGISKKLFAISMIISILSTIITIIFPIYIKKSVDLYQSNNLETRDIIIVITMFIMSSLLGSISLYIFKYIGSLSMFKIRAYIWEKILNLNVKTITLYESGEIISRIKNDIEELNSFLTNTLPNTFNYALIFIASICMLLYLDYKITIIIFIFIPIICLIIFPIGNVTYKISQDLQDKLSTFTSTISNVLSNIILVKTYTSEKREYNRVYNILNLLFKIQLREAKIQSLIAPIMSLVSMGTILFIVGYATFRIHNGDLTTGTFIAILYYLFQIIPSILTFSSLYNDIQKVRGANKKISEILSLHESEEISIFLEAKKLSPGDLQIKNLSFSYDDKKVLENINLNIKKGETIAIVGPSGAGKSTLFNILLKLHSDYEGEINYDGTSINSIDVQTWRENISYVPQGNNIISGTILDNVIYGTKKILCMNEIVEKCKNSNIYSFIQETDKGFLTKTGENGILLSGGQRQRISFARALLKNSNIYLLDEFSSNLDSETERLLVDNISSLLAPKTTIIIAHRMSTIVNADRIIFMEKGKITGEGSHKNLYSSHKLYKLYVDSQNIFNE